MMILSLLLPARPNRWLNITLGMFHTRVMLFKMPGAWASNITLGAIQVLLSLTIAVFALIGHEQRAKRKAVVDISNIIVPQGPTV
jgi:hypothetical protein